MWFCDQAALQWEQMKDQKKHVPIRFIDVLVWKRKNYFPFRLTVSRANKKVAS